MAAAWGLKSLTAKFRIRSGDHHWVVLPPVGRLSPSGFVAEPQFIPRRGLGGYLDSTSQWPRSDNGGDPESLSGGGGSGEGVFARSLLILWCHLSALGTPVADDTG